MAYSQVERRVWHDERFRRWPREVRDVWLYLLTCPHSNRIGCFVLDPFYAAADVHLPVDQVEAALQRLEVDHRIAYDPDTRVVLVLRHLKHNPMRNPNVVKAAVAVDLQELPDTPKLFRELLRAVEEYGPAETAKGEPFYSLLTDALRTRLTPNPQPGGGLNSSGNGSANSYPNSMPNPEHDPDPEQEPDQEQDQKAAAASRTREGELTEDQRLEQAITSIIQAANGGMEENPKLGGFNPIPTGGAGRQDVRDWIVELGYPVSLCLRVVREKAKGYKPLNEGDQIGTMRYFAGPLAQEHAKPRPGSPAAAVTKELPGQGRTTQGELRRPSEPTEEEKRKAEREAERQAVDEWRKAHPEEAEAVWKEAVLEIKRNEFLKKLAERDPERVAYGEFARRVLARIQPKAS